MTSLQDGSLLHRSPSRDQHDPIHAAITHLSDASTPTFTADPQDYPTGSSRDGRAARHRRQLAPQYGPACAPISSAAA